MPAAIPRQQHAHTLGLPAILGAILAVCLLVWLGLRHLALPAPIAITAPPQAFSAQRAAITVATIARQAHPTGTAENAQVRADLVAALRRLGLEPEVQTGISQSPGTQTIGQVHNIIVRLPGTSPAKSLLIAAHYDSVPQGPGAADNGASVAALLETLRALRAGPPLQNDIVCLLSDGEELGLLGARLFMQEHRLAKNIGLAINFDNRGNSGPAWLFETSAGNAKVIGGVAQSVPLPLGNSLLNEIYKVMPNDTDLTVFKRAHVPALNFAAAEGYMSYHTALDRPDTLNPGTLQHMGDTMLALAKYFGNAPLGDLMAQDSIYADLPVVGLVHYSQQWLWPLFFGCALLWLTASIAAKRHAAIRIGHMLSSVPILLILVALPPLACQLAWRAVLLAYPDYHLLLHGSTYNSGWYGLFFVFLSLGLFIHVQRYLVRWLWPLELGLAAMLVWILALLVASMAVPGASFLLTWPLLPVLAALNVSLAMRPAFASGSVKLAILVAGLAPGCIVLPPILNLIYHALTPHLIWVPVLILALFLALAIPLLDAVSSRPAVRMAPWLLAAGGLIMAGLHAGFDAEHPRPNNLSYVQPPGGASALWASTDEKLDAWTKSFFPRETVQRNESGIFGQTAPRQWLAAAPALHIPVPDIEVTADQVVGTVRTVTLSVSSPRLAPRIDIAVDGVKVLRSTVQGRPYAAKSGENWRVKTFGMQQQPIVVTLEMAPLQAFRAWARDYSYGLPATGVQPRPAGMMIQPFKDSDTTQAINSMLIQ